MPELELIAVALGMSIFLVSLGLFYRVHRLAAVRKLRRWWAFLGLLVVFFLAGYTAFFVFLIEGATPIFDINLMISQIFFWGSVFVLVCAWLFHATLRQHKQTDQQLHDALTRLRQAQKLEAVGRLAGNVAHDFNNILTAIIGHADIGSYSIDASAPEFENFSQISTAAHRAEKLTRQLLAFSRKKPIRKEPLSLEQLFHDIDTLLKQSLNPEVHLTINAETPGWVIGDPDELKLLIINLVSNANDAVAQGGSITVRIGQASTDTASKLFSAIDEDASARDYVELAVTDNGHGIAEEIRLQIFEPYFTTKDLGKGTGLGLAIAYGIARQHDGLIEVESTSSKGSTFTTYLPAAKPQLSSPQPKAQTEIHITPKADATRVLVVDDDQQVANLTNLILEKAGYDVIVARSSAEALLLIEDRGERFGLMLCDIILPHMHGPELVDRIRRLHPEIPVVFMTGYPGEDTDLFPRISDANKLVMKPFSPKHLLETVGKIL
jgi:two-component system cell cycle sensor histidine kinase/response regulator CckA